MIDGSVFSLAIWVRDVLLLAHGLHEVGLAPLANDLLRLEVL